MTFLTGTLGENRKGNKNTKSPHCDILFKMQQNYREHVKVKHEKVHRTNVISAIVLMEH